MKASWFGFPDRSWDAPRIEDAQTRHRGGSKGFVTFAPPSAAGPLPDVVRVDGVVRDGGRRCRHRDVRRASRGLTGDSARRGRRVFFDGGRGPEAWIAKTLSIDVAGVRRKRDLLDGVCPEAAELLKGQRATAGAIRGMCKVKPMRQIEMAELMTALANFSVEYARRLLAATPRDQLADSERSKEVAGLSPEDVARIERGNREPGAGVSCAGGHARQERPQLGHRRGYLKRLLDSGRAVRYLSSAHSEILAEFQKLGETRGLTETARSGG